MGHRRVDNLQVQKFESSEFNLDMTNDQRLKVCVIGAGVCGLVATKICLESSFKVTCFDRSPHYGGLWNYRDSDESFDANGDFIPSVMRTTILNTSKELSAFSDFPPPPETPNFMKHDLYMNYIRSYVEHFKVLPHVKLEHQVLNCKPKASANGDVSWLVEVKNLRTKEVEKLEFDKLMVAVGHHNIPYEPKFEDQHKFKGEIIHSVQLKNILNDKRIIDKRVVVVGFGNSACDAANDIALVAKKCYVSCHRGNWFRSRLTPKGVGLSDFKQQTKWAHFRSQYFPSVLNERQALRRVSRVTNHQLLGLEPKHKPSELAPAVNDLFPYRVFTGGTHIKSAIERFTEHGVVFEAEDGAECQVDVVVFATGYTAKVRFMDEISLGIKSADTNEYDLFLNIFAPKLSAPGIDLTANPRPIKSLAFIGFVQPNGSMTVLGELQSRYAALVFSGKLDLPSVSEMLKFGQRFQAARSKTVRSHSRDQLVGNLVGYLDEVASRAGLKPNLSKMLVSDFPLWRRLVFGPNVSYQYRLTGPGSCERAREFIMSVDERVYMGINEGKNHLLFKSRRKYLKEEPKGRQNGVKT